MAHHGRAAARSVTAAVALVVAASGLVGGCGRSVASASTTLHRVHSATVQHRDGRVEPATDGMRVRGGDVVRTAANGRAQLTTLDRVVYVGPDAVVSVVDGERQQLRHGAAVIDARRGDALRMAIAGFSVRVARGAVRVERGYAMRVGVLSGAADVVSVAGRSVHVRALHQVVAVGDALPDRTSPLRLTGDDAERRVAPTLVADDDRLRAVATGIDEAPATHVVSAVSAAWGRPVPAVAVAAPASERILPVAIAVAAHTDAWRVYADRADGGSWGVVARLRGTDGDRALAALDTLERGVPVSALGPVDLVAAVSGTGGASGASGRVGASGGTETGGRQPRAGSGGSASPRPTTSPSPSPSPDLVTSVVDTVERVLPAPTPTPSPSQSPLVTLPGVPELLSPAGG